MSVAGPRQRRRRDIGVDLFTSIEVEPANLRLQTLEA
jgi:hypothetical protein